MCPNYFYLLPTSRSYSISCLQKPSFGLAEGRACLTRWKAFCKHSFLLHIKNAITTVEDLDTPALLEKIWKKCTLVQF
jgi:hypothetical protein